MNETTTATATRFALDEDAARAWLAAGVAADYLTRQDADNTLPDISEDWWACVSDGTSDVSELISGARAHGIITGPAGVRIDLDADSGGDGYRWLLFVFPQGTQGLILAGTFENRDTVGDHLSHGAMAALSVLTEAVMVANGLLDDLDAYAAATGQETGQ